jgi:hypothetical protein
MICSAFTATSRLLPATALAAFSLTALAVPAAADPTSTLESFLPQGYDSSDCEPASFYAPAIAAINCGPNRETGGPTEATYYLYPDRAAMNRDHEGMAEQVRTHSCAESNTNDTTWSYEGTPDVDAGSLFCGLYTGESDKHNVLVWTDNARLYAGVTFTDPTAKAEAALYRWWQEYTL